MAQSIVCDPDSGVLKRHWVFDWCENLVGTKEQLQSLGIGLDICFPGEPGSKPRQITVPFRGHKLSIKKLCYEAGFFEVRIKYNEQYREKIRREEERREIERKEAKEQAEKIKKCEYLAEHITSNPEDYRLMMKMFLCSDYFAGNGGYKFESRMAQRLDALANEMREIIEDADIVFDQVARDENIREIYRKEGLEPPAQLRREKPVLRLVK